MKALIAIGIFMAVAAFALADDFKLVNGYEYKNVTVTSVEPDGIHVMTDSGNDKIYFAWLPKEVQQKYNYNPQAAASYASQEALAQQLRSQAAEQDRQEAAATTQQLQQTQESTKAVAMKMADAKGICVRISQVTSGGVIADESSEDWNGGIPTGELNGKRIFVYGTIPGATEDNYWLMKAYRDGSYTFTDTSGAKRTLEKWVFVSGAETKTMAP